MTSKLGDPLSRQIVAMLFWRYKELTQLRKKRSLKDYEDPLLRSLLDFEEGEITQAWNAFCAAKKFLYEST